mgnify:CR=1 FL=1
MGKKNQISDSIYSNALIWDAHAGSELTSERDLETLSVWKDAGINYPSVNFGYDGRDWRTTIKNLSLSRRCIIKLEHLELYVRI